MAEYNKAFVVGGWSENKNFLWGLANEISTGKFSIVSDAETVTLAEAQRKKDKFLKEAQNRIVIAHSAGMMAIRRAGIVIAINGAEPTPFLMAVRGALRLSTKSNTEPDFDHVIATGLSDGLREVMLHPSQLITVPLRLRAFSTLQRLTESNTSFPDGRVYLPTEHDEFGFGSHGEVEVALEHGIVARMLPGYHNQPLQRPQEGAKDIAWAIDQLNT